jgi:hypothetical protein
MFSKTHLVTLFTPADKTCCKKSSNFKNYTSSAWNGYIRKLHTIHLTIEAETATKPNQKYSKSTVLDIFAQTAAQGIALAGVRGATICCRSQKCRKNN